MSHLWHSLAVVGVTSTSFCLVDPVLVLRLRHASGCSIRTRSCLPTCFDVVQYPTGGFARLDSWALRSSMEPAPRGDDDTIGDGAGRPECDTPGSQWERVGSYGEGGTYQIKHLLPPELARQLVAELAASKAWQYVHSSGKKCTRRPFLSQAAPCGDGSMPLYRFPTDHPVHTSRFSPVMAQVAEYLNAAMGHSASKAHEGEAATSLSSGLNHVKVQYYADGRVKIAPHSDKTLDMGLNLPFVNVNLGAARNFCLRRKDKDASTGRRRVQTILMEHNSAIVIDWRTNELWRHYVPAARRHVGPRFSLVFRHIRTYVTDAGVVYGQGGLASTPRRAAAATDGAPDPMTQAKLLTSAFAHQSQRSDFDWDAHYACGFSVLDNGAASDAYCAHVVPFQLDMNHAALDRLLGFLEPTDAEDCSASPIVHDERGQEAGAGAGAGAGAAVSAPGAGDPLLCADAAADAGSPLIAE